MQIDTQPARRLSEPEAEQLVRRLYGISGRAQPLAGEYDSNYHLTAPGGRAFVLKVMHPTRERAFVDLQCQALLTLAQRAPTLARGLGWSARSRHGRGAPGPGSRPGR